MKKFSEEYKNDAVKMVIETGVNVSVVSNDLGIGKSTLDKWIRVYKSKNQTAAININEREELRNLKAENLKLKLERDLLKKASIFFATDRSS